MNDMYPKMEIARRKIRIMQIKLNEAIVFQKLTDQEYVILSALDYLNT